MRRTSSCGKRIIMQPTFDPAQNVRFREKPIADLSPDELREALVQALLRIRLYEDCAGFRPPKTDSYEFQHALWPRPQSSTCRA